ncbi:MAG TPA: 30S ribosomal protein S20 [Terriglobales bacterium]|nr:30S ribosomal protein S20 [Terriglobales bacterium]
MANHASALKRVRQTRRRTARNRANTHRVRTAIKQLRAVVASRDKAGAHALLPATMAAIDKAIQKGVLHHRAADRYKSKLSIAVNRMA